MKLFRQKVIVVLTGMVLDMDRSGEMRRSLLTDKDYGN